jgi:putative transcriptional regulator
MTRRKLLASMASIAAAAAQPRVPGVKPAAGRFLVAARELADPNFARSVVLLGQYEEKGAMGLTINRPSAMTIGEALAGFKAAKERKDPAYLGGPVVRTGVLALVRSASKPDDAKPVFGDVYLVSTRPLLEKLLATADATRLRVYLGYAGWGAGQLEMELEIGSWHVISADAATVFDTSPASVWPRLIKRTDLRIA